MNQRLLLTCLLLAQGITHAADRLLRAPSSCKAFVVHSTNRPSCEQAIIAHREQKLPREISIQILRQWLQQDEPFQARDLHKKRVMILDYVLENDLTRELLATFTQQNAFFSDLHALLSFAESYLHVLSTKTKTVGIALAPQHLEIKEANCQKLIAHINNILFKTQELFELNCINLDYKALDDQFNDGLIQLRINHDPMIFHALSTKNDVLLEYLLQKKANPNCRNTTSKTALMIAAEANNKNAVEILLKYGADKKIIYKKGNTVTNNIQIASTLTTTIISAVALYPQFATLMQLTTKPLSATMSTIKTHIKRQALLFSIGKIGRASTSSILPVAVLLATITSTFTPWLILRGSVNIAALKITSYDILQQVGLHFLGKCLSPEKRKLMIGAALAANLVYSTYYTIPQYLATKRRLIIPQTAFDIAQETSYLDPQYDQTILQLLQ